MSNAIANAIEPLRQDAIKSAKDFAEKLVTATIEGQKADPEAYKYPRSTYNRGEYQMKLARYTRFQALTSDGVLVQEKADKFVAECVAAAELQYTAFIEKLCAKIGACESAKLEGNHIWSYSILTVTMADGSEQFWKTQMIINVSKLGRPFNQWPTRRVKCA